MAEFAITAQHILLVEDHAATLEVMARLLRRDGHRVVAANNVEEALRAGREHRFDVLIADMGLPDGSGWDLLATLRESHPVIGIALSGYGMERDVQRARAAGFSVHATKPVDLATLRRLIAGALGG